MDTTHDKLPHELRAQHDAVMNSEPVEYRGYLIKPVSHRVQPYYDRGRFTYWGWNVIYASGPYAGCNAGPGATWGKSIGQAKSIIDCLHEAGPRPMYTDVRTTKEENARRLVAMGEWNDQFWKLLGERN